MIKGLFTVLGWAVVGAGLGLAQTPAEPAPTPTDLPRPGLALEPLPPVYSGGPVLTPVQSAPALPPLKKMGGFAVTADYLLWWVRDSGMPGPLVTTGDVASAGILGRNGTQVVYGGSGIDQDHFNGLRMTGTFWMDDEQKLGFRWSGFVLEGQSEIFLARSDAAGNPVIARPIFDSLRRQETVSLVSFPDAFAGGIGSSLSTRLWGCESNAIGTLKSTDMMKLRWLAGYRYLRLDDKLNIYQTPTLLEDGLAGFFGDVLQAGDTLAIHDQFLAKNQFWGGQIGGEADLKLGPAVINGYAKLALGDSNQALDVNGSTVLLRPGDPARAGGGGVYTTLGNIGRYRHNVFAVVPELGFNVGIQPMRNVRAMVGYTFLYWSSVIRASDQVSRITNPTTVPSSLRYGPVQGSPQPQVPFDQTDFWRRG